MTEHSKQAPTPCSHFCPFRTSKLARPCLFHHIPVSIGCDWRAAEQIEEDSGQRRNEMQGRKAMREQNKTRVVAYGCTTYESSNDGISKVMPVLRNRLIASIIGRQENFEVMAFTKYIVQPKVVRYVVEREVTCSRDVRRLSCTGRLTSSPIVKL
jgi:hypothetical protein